MPSRPESVPAARRSVGVTSVRPPDPAHRPAGAGAVVLPLHPPVPAVPPPVAAVMALVGSLTDARLRRYCLDQILAAESRAEVSDAIALVSALAASQQPAPPQPAPDMGQGQPPAQRPILSRQRKGSLTCIATSSSP